MPYRESCYATAYFCNEESFIRMLFGKGYKLIDMGPDGIYITLHSRDSIGLSL